MSSLGRAMALAGLAGVLIGCAGRQDGREYGRVWPPVLPTEALAAEPTPAPVVRVQLDVKFDFDKQTVKPESYGELQNVAQFMAQFPHTTTLVEGHTDEVGTDAYNQRLSERRAMAVRQVLVDEFGIHPGRVDAIGFGEARPIASNASDEGRALNRRVEAVVEAREM